MLDPIDGTVNYLYRDDQFAVSVAVVRGDPAAPGAWEPLAGAVAAPALGCVYHAHRGGGSRRTDQTGTVTLATSGATELSLTLLGTGFAYLAAERRRQAERLVRILPLVRDIRRRGSAALDLCSVADGALDGYYERGINAWDIAAGWLVVTEAGGLVTGVGDLRPSPEGIVAAAPGVHADLLNVVEAATFGR